MTAPKSISRIWILGLGITIYFIAALIASSAFAAQVTLAWDPNTESDLAGYRVHFGTASGNYSVHTDVHTVITYTVTGLADGQTYYFAVSANDASGNESGYSNEVSYSVPAPNGAPSTPATPSGASSALVNTAITFSTSATDPNGDSLQYRYDWGDGALSSYGVASQSHSWSAAGQYAVKAQARDSLGAESAWSSAKTVTVSTSSASLTSNGAPTRPSTPSGPASAVVNVVITFSTSASDPNGDSLQYRFDWGGGVYSAWGAASQSHSWAAAGQYSVRAQARDPIGAVSSWSRAKSVNIQDDRQVQSPDTDGDGVPDNQDAFPNDPNEWSDANGNGIGDNADAAAQGSISPDAPVLISPVSNSVVDTVAELKTGPFISPISGTTHAQTRWQVFREEDDTCLLDIQCATALTSFTLPKLVLDEGTAFFWRAQFFDSNGAVSPWSDYEYFSTQTSGTDLNANGIPDSQEAEASADLNKDGVPDSQQIVIKSVKMEGTNTQIGVSIEGSSTAIAIESVESEDPGKPDLYPNGKPQNMPFGILDIKIAVANPGDQAVVKLYFLEPVPAGAIWYEHDTVTDRWVDFSAYTEFADDRMSATLTLRDGGPEDSDGVANGVIIDPGGIALGYFEPGSGSASQNGGGGGGGGCFIGTVHDSEMTGSMLGALCLFGFFSLLNLLRFKIEALRLDATLE